MRILLFKRKDAHYRWYCGLVDYLESKGHKVYLRIGRPPRKLDYDRVIIWNGNHLTDKHLAKRCRLSKIPVAFLEVGFFPQNHFYMLSRNGSVGGDLFKDEIIPDLPIGGEEYLQQKFIEYAGEDVIRKTEGYSQDYVAGFLQIPDDTAIRNHSSFSGMQEFVDAAEALFPDERVIFKVHPKKRRVYEKTRHPLYRGDGIWLHALRSKHCIAVNSTSLYECVLAGLKVTALGECPLKSNPNRHREIVHEILLRQIPISSIEIEERIVRSVGNFFE